ncbi:MAG: GAF domain-containing protein, partial [Desulfobacteraceae bacterium]
MEKPRLNYETLIRLTKAIPKLRDPDAIILVTVEGITHTLRVKGCSLFLFSPMSEDLKLAGSYGLSQEYLDKGPISSMRSIASALMDGQPVAIYDVSDDPRIQYPEEAV